MYMGDNSSQGDTTVEQSFLDRVTLPTTRSRPFNIFLFWSNIVEFECKFKFKLLVLLCSFQSASSLLESTVVGFLFMFIKDEENWLNF